jgi:predicted transposase/invertase (TIGR01784 family)
MFFNSTFISPYTDFGFKKLFGEEDCEDILIDFLNELLKNEQEKIVSLKFLKNEQLESNANYRNAIFDLYCVTDTGDHFIVEMQKAPHDFFKDRMVFYSTFPIREQAKVPGWNYELKPIYCIAILNFVFPEDKDNLEKFRYDVKLTDTDSHKIFYDKLTFIYLEMPKFNKTLEELQTGFDKWMYLIKNMADMKNIPEELHNPIFDKFMEKARVCNFSDQESWAYFKSWKSMTDWFAIFDTGYREAYNDGLEKGKLNVAKNMKNIEMSISDIISATGLDEETIQRL